jgi:hypothetical protein
VKLYEVRRGPAEHDMQRAVGMLDLLMLTMLAAAFALAFGYVWACDGMTGRHGAASDILP